MALITKIKVKILTGDRSGAGTDGLIYIGIGGREFKIDSTADDFEPATVRTYVLRTPPSTYDDPALGLEPGERPIRHPKHNDPSKDYPLDSANLPSFPVYVRFEPRYVADNWNIEEVEFAVFAEEQLVVTFKGLGESSHLWLGANFGKIFYLPNVAKTAKTAAK